MSRQRIAVTWEMCGYIDVDADTVEEGMKKVREDPDAFSLPHDGGSYVDGSFRLSTDDVDIMKAICGF